MDNHATYDDANLILRLFEQRRDDKMRAARNWFVVNFYCTTFDEMMQLCPPGSEQNAYYRMIVSYWEMVASFITSDVLHDELFFQSGQELLLTWMRVKPIVGVTREMFGNPNAYKNLEAVGERFIAYWNRTAPGAYEAFHARIGVRPVKKAE